MVVAMRGRSVYAAQPAQPAQRRWLGLVYLGLAPLIAVIGLGAGLPTRPTLAVAVALLVLGVVEIGRTRLAVVRARTAADTLLRTGVRVHPASELLVRRAAELTSDRNRKSLSRSLGRIVRELERPVLASPVPLDRRNVGPHVDLVAALAARVGQLERPVAPRGMVLVEELLMDGVASPLYLGGRAEDVPVALGRCLAALDGADAGDGVVVDAADRFRRDRGDDLGPRAHSGGSH